MVSNIEVVQTEKVSGLGWNFKFYQGRFAKGFQSLKCLFQSNETSDNLLINLKYKFI